VRISEIVSEFSHQFRIAGIPGPILDAEILVAHAVGLERMRLHVGDDRELTPSELRRARRLALRRLRREPVAYLTGRKEFYSLEFFVNRNVLIPRPETELLVDLAIYHTPQGGLFADIGTGSGAVAIAVKHARWDIRVHATDLSERALVVARRNASRILGRGAVHFHRGDLFSPLAWTRFDVIASNPPYVAHERAASLQPEIAYEPSQALFAPNGGRAVIERLVREAGAHLAEHGALIIEIGEDMAAFVKRIGAAAGFSVSVLNDYAGLPRVALMKRSQGG